MSNSPPPYSLVAIDLDGTLLGPDSNISILAKQTLQQLSCKGIYIILATGRHHADVSIILQNLQLPYPGFLITSNGARMHTTGTGNLNNNNNNNNNNNIISEHNNQNEKLELVFEHNIDSNVVCGLYQILPPNEEEINVNIYQGDEWKCSLNWKDELIYVKESGFRYKLVNLDELVKQYKLFLQQQKQKQNKEEYNNEIKEEYINPFIGVGKVAFGSDNKERLHELESRILEKYKGKVEVAFSSPNCLDVTAINVTKAKGVEELISLLNQKQENNNNNNIHLLSMANCIAFGDSMNDKDMLASVGKGCIMGNGQARLKESLPHLEIINTNAEDGVAKKLLEVFSLE